jgi:4-hydroxy-tetrahydrodipicolinate reductase
MLADSVNKAFDGKKEYLNGRSGNVGKRGSEIGIHAVRGGTIVGEHDVLFCGEDEEITLSHRASSKKVFAAGAVRAAKFVAGMPAGKYDMSDVLKNL